MRRFERLAIVGAGLIGASVGLAARRRWPDLDIRLVDQGDDLAPLRLADVIALAAPVDVILSLIPRLDTLAHHEALLVDTGSTKHAIVSAARIAGLTRFVGGHPMAGGATKGPAGARDDLFDGRPWILIRGSADPSAMTDATAFVNGLGATSVVQDDDGQMHDRVMAAVSHVPQVVASVLMRRVGETVGGEGLALAGSGLRDTTRLATSDASMWSSVLETNADQIAPILAALARDLERAAGQLGDAEAMARLFADAQKWKGRTPG